MLEDSILENEFVAVAVDDDGVLAVHFTGKYVLGKLVEHHPLDRTLHGACSEFRVVAILCEKLQVGFVTSSFTPLEASIFCTPFT